MSEPNPWIPVLNDAWNHSKHVVISLRNGERHKGNVTSGQLADDAMIVTLQDYTGAHYNRPGPAVLLLSEIVAVTS